MRYIQSLTLVLFLSASCTQAYAEEKSNTCVAAHRKLLKELLVKVEQTLGTPISAHDKRGFSIEEKLDPNECIVVVSGKIHYEENIDTIQVTFKKTNESWIILSINYPERDAAAKKLSMTNLPSLTTEVEATPPKIVPGSAYLPGAPESIVQTNPDRTPKMYLDNIISLKHLSFDKDIPPDLKRVVTKYLTALEEDDFETAESIRYSLIEDRSRWTWDIRNNIVEFTQVSIDQEHSKLKWNDFVEVEEASPIIILRIKHLDRESQTETIRRYLFAEKDKSWKLARID
ncbi:hypothetical protein FHS18_005510 [Paenibacillus phyllosphaerae]|uniref:Uncharacterized protein n=1 Tax=Paenibacillus phyllosphaerae TaxID=274593 RepID=A0A7W5FQK8_9BACL|nr:hypothetical protein [Paenibacillus phyllosphaerae]MBB3113398.1 hypothetical protein [Paenibacillus phyllosphaerae]